MRSASKKAVDRLGLEEGRQLEVACCLEEEIFLAGVGKRKEGEKICDKIRNSFELVNKETGSKRVCKAKD